MEKRNCLKCGKEFLTWNSPSRKDRGKFCSRSCGNSFTGLVHGHNKRSGATPTYRTWNVMIQRCHNPSHEKFSQYGALGIQVCDRWRMSFENFLGDMGERPSGHTIDRLDGSLGYVPGNCRWANPANQQRNLKSNKAYEHGGRSQLLCDWAKESGISSGTIANRLARGWTFEQAISVPAKLGNRIKTRTVHTQPDADSPSPEA